MRRTIPKVASYSDGSPVPLLISDRYNVQINPEADLSVDVYRMDQLLDEIHTHGHLRLGGCETCRQTLERALAIYHGEFLSGFYLDDSTLYEDWVEAHREPCRRKALDAMSTLADIYLQKEDYDQTKSLAESQLAIDPLREKAYREMMMALARSGHRAKALRQYRVCQQILERELGVMPSQETTDLYERIQAAGEPVGPPPPPSTIVSRRVIPHHNLAHQAMPFMGRKEELEQLDQWLYNPNNRLITIIGPSGMGKTRLAIACAERQLLPNNFDQTPPFPDGVFFVPLASLNRADQIPAAIATAINFPLNANRSLREGIQSVDPFKENLRQYLRNKVALLILDNFDHLIEGTELITDLLEATHLLNIIITTGERLYIQGGEVLPLHGLNFLDWEAPESPRDLAAIELFLHHARRIQSVFRLRNGDMVHLARICSLVGGIPLALELTAGWVDKLSLAEIAKEIHNSLDSLGTDYRDLPERRPSIRAVCDSTWRLLSEPEQRSFSRLSIFRGGFSLTAVQEICGQSFHLLTGLVNKSLLQYNPTTEYYQMHEFLRRFAAEKLVKNPIEASNLRDRHSAYYCDLVKQYGKYISEGEMQRGINGFNTDLGNIQAGWDWAIQQCTVKNLLTAFQGICGYFNNTQQFQRTLETCDSVARVVEKTVVNFSLNAEIRPDMVDDLRLYAWVLAYKGNAISFLINRWSDESSLNMRQPSKNSLAR